MRALYLIGAYIADLDRRLAHLYSLGRLEMLLIPFGELSEEGIQRVARLKSLREVNLHSTSVTDGGLRALASMPRLESLAFREAMDEHSLTQLGGLHNLRYLHIGEL